MQRTRDIERSCRWLRLVFFYDDTGIMAAKTKGIAQGRPYCSLLWFPESEVKPCVQLGVVGKMVGGGRYPVMPHAHHTGDGLDDTRRTQAVACHGLGGADVDGIGLFTKYVRDSLYLGNIAQGR